jgi:hypothetical protein
MSLALNQYKYSPDELRDTVKVRNCMNSTDNISIGNALSYLHVVARMDSGDLEGGVDGLDALVYHLGGDTCDKAIEALQKVKDRFEKYRVARVASENP